MSRKSRAASRSRRRARITYLYVVTDGYAGDAGDYQGHLTTINLANGDQNVFNTLCSDNPTTSISGGNNCDRPLASDFGGSGIWGRGGATFDAGTEPRLHRDRQRLVRREHGGQFNWGDSVLALLPDGAGASGAAGRQLHAGRISCSSSIRTSISARCRSRSCRCRPAHAVTHLGVQLGKDAQIRLIDSRQHERHEPRRLGRRRAAAIDVPQGGGGMSEQPAVWVDRQWRHVASRREQLRRFGAEAPLQRARARRSSKSQWNHGGTAKSAIVANDVLYYAASCGGELLHERRGPRHRRRAVDVERASRRSCTGKARSSSTARSTSPTARICSASTQRRDAHRHADGRTGGSIAPTRRRRSVRRRDDKLHDHAGC